MDKLPKRVKRIVYYVIGFFMVWLLEPILLDLKLLLLMAIIGEALDMILFSWRIKRMKEDMLIDRTAEVTSEKVEQAIQNAVEKLNGRV
jgi:Na+-driven multidrug efflux pump